MIKISLYPKSKTPQPHPTVGEFVSSLLGGGKKNADVGAAKSIIEMAYHKAGG